MKKNADSPKKTSASIRPHYSTAAAIGDLTLAIVRDAGQIPHGELLRMIREGGFTKSHARETIHGLSQYGTLSVAVESEPGKPYGRHCVMVRPGGEV